MTNGQSTMQSDTAQRHRHKYENKNPIHQLVLNRFFDALAEELNRIRPQSVLDIGCGEGMLLKQLEKRVLDFPELMGLDIREEAIQEARSNFPRYTFTKADLLSWEPASKEFDLLLCSQVLEHLHEPENYLKRINDLACSSMIFTVPWEPWFRLMNFLRGRDLTRFGDHPEHVNHWGKRSFRRFVESVFQIEKCREVFPFLIVVARPRDREGQSGV